MPTMEKILNPSNDFDSSSVPPKTKGSSGASGGLKFAVFIAFILALLSLAGSGWLYQSLNAERRDRQALEGAQDQIRDKSLTLEKVSEDYKSKIEELEGKVQSFETERGQFKKAIEENRSLIMTLQTKLKAVEEVKNKALEMQTVKPVEIASPVNRIVDTASVAKPVKPAAAAVQPVTPAAPRPSQILTVNRKFNFVVVSLGVKDGLQMGDAIEVVRQDKVVANVQVEKLYENFAAATIVSESKEAPVKEGDLIRKLSA